MTFSQSINLIRLNILILASGCLLNLNGVGLMVIGVNQLFSPFMLFTSCFILGMAIKQHLAVSDELQIYLTSVFIYLIIGGVVAVLFSNVLFNLSLTFSLLIKYITSVLIVMAGYYSVLFSINRIEKLMRLVLVLCFIASIFIPFGDVVNISGKIASHGERGSGLFGNPNEAGVIAAVGMAVTLVAINRIWLKVCLACFFFSMALFTFSKTAFFMVVAIWLLNIAVKNNVSKGIMRLVLFAIILFSFLALFRDVIVLMFDGHQAKRVGQILDLILFSSSESAGGGGIEESRGYLWKIGLHKISQNPFWGNGLGALHSMDGGNLSVNTNVRQGVHNTYLVKLGDAGVIALIAFIGFLLIFGKRTLNLARTNLYARFCFLYIIIFSLSCMATHGAETLRFHNFLLGFSLGLLYISKQKNIPTTPY